VLSGGTIECWGGNPWGQLGDGTTNNATTPTAVSGPTGVTSVSVGYQSACALLSNGTVQCWGDNNEGQIGYSPTLSETCGSSSLKCQRTPIGVSGVTGATAITVGEFHACALVSGGGVECWGDNQYGELGDGVSGAGTNSSSPVTVSGLSGATAISAGTDFVCALLSGGTVECWGDNDFGQLGNGTMTSSSTPVTVSGVSGARAIAAGDGFACALLSAGTVACWGYSQNGQLGNGSTTGPDLCCYDKGADGGCVATSPCSTTPVAVSCLSGVTAISAGGAATCALLSGGTVECWGYNENGELGNGTMTFSATPVPVVW
jgi:alpha-tubulin suppressor-like RCC1 family protein